MKMDLEFTCKTVSITPNHNEVAVSIGSVQNVDILEHFSLKEIIIHFGYDSFLDEIGVDQVKQYFSLSE